MLSFTIFWTFGNTSFYVEATQFNPCKYFESHQVSKWQEKCCFYFYLRYRWFSKSLSEKHTTAFFVANHVEKGGGGRILLSWRWHDDCSWISDVLIDKMSFAKSVDVKTVNLDLTWVVMVELQLYTSAKRKSSRDIEIVYFAIITIPCFT